MITARPHFLAHATLGRLVLRAIKKRFRAFLVDNHSDLPRALSKHAVLIAPNHTNWWDGFVAYALDHHLLKTQVFLAQQEEHLKRYQFFRLLGAYGLPRDRVPLEAMHYSLHLLETPGHQVWIFPQGRLSHPTEPIRVERGVEFLAKRSGCPVFPLAIRYEWLEESRPTIFVRIGPAWDEQTTFEQALKNEIASLDRTIRQSRFDTFQTLWRPRPSINQSWDAFLSRIQKPRHTRTS